MSSRKGSHGCRRPLAIVYSSLKLVALAPVLLLVLSHTQAQVITTIAGGGPNNISALNAGVRGVSTPGLFGYEAIAADAARNFYVAPAAELNEGPNLVYKIDATGKLTIFAGNGVAGFGGDGGPATSAELNNPQALAVDGNGNVYIADTGNYRVRKVDVSGTISTIAGTGAFLYNGGDGGPATSVNLSSPVGLAVDHNGNVFISDLNRVRKVDAFGMISTVAGTGAYGNSGDGGPAILAELYEPRGLAVDSNANLYIAITDPVDSMVRKIDSAGIISTVAGTDIFGPGGGDGIALDRDGNLYLADHYNNRIGKVDTSGVASVIVGTGTPGFSGDGGLAINAELHSPMGVAVDGNGNLYIADSVNNRIRKVDTTGDISTVAGNGTVQYGGDGGPAVDAQLFRTSAVAADLSGNLYIADTGNNRIRKVDRFGNIFTVAGNGTNGYSGDGGPAANAELNSPYGVAIDLTGNVYIADTYNNVVRKIDALGIISTVAGTGSGVPNGNSGPARSIDLSEPAMLATDSNGNLYIGSGARLTIRKLDPLGNITTILGDSPFIADAIAVDQNGNIYFANGDVNGEVFKIDASGTISPFAGSGVTTFTGDGGPATNAGMGAAGLAIGRSGSVYIADLLNNRVRKVDTSGTISTIAGNGIQGFSGDGGLAIDAELDYPCAMTMDARGSLYVIDDGNPLLELVNPNQRIRKIDNVEPFVTITGSPQQPITKNLAGNYVAQITITNSGNITIDSVQVTTAGTTLGIGSPLAKPAPITNLAPGASAVMTLKFPPSAVKNGATSAPLKVSGTYSVSNPVLNGNWNLSFRSVSLQ